MQFRLRLAHNRASAYGALVCSVFLAKDDPEAEGRVAAFQQALAASGWTEGVNVRIDYRWAGGDADRVRKYATELITAFAGRHFSGRQSSWTAAPSDT